MSRGSNSRDPLPRAPAVSFSGITYTIPPAATRTALRCLWHPAVLPWVQGGLDSADAAAQVGGAAPAGGTLPSPRARAREEHCLTSDGFKTQGHGEVAARRRRARGAWATRPACGYCSKATARAHGNGSRGAPVCGRAALPPAHGARAPCSSGDVRAASAALGAAAGTLVRDLRQGAEAAHDRRGARGSARGLVSTSLPVASRARRCESSAPRQLAQPRVHSCRPIHAPSPKCMPLPPGASLPQGRTARGCRRTRLRALHTCLRGSGSARLPRLLLLLVCGCESLPWRCAPPRPAAVCVQLDLDL